MMEWGISTKGAQDKRETPLFTRQVSTDNSSTDMNPGSWESIKQQHKQKASSKLFWFLLKINNC